MAHPYYLLPGLDGLDPDQAALRPPAGINGPWLARQLKGRATAKSKVPSWFALPEIEYPPSASLAQASSEATACYKAALLAGHAVADLCGGTGVDAWFMAQSATGYLFNEPDAALLATAKHNLALIPKAPRISFLQQSAEAFTPVQLAGFTAIYLDPSRRHAGGARAWSWATMQPNLTAMPWLWGGPWAVLIKLSPGQDFTEVERHLPVQPLWHIVCHGSEVKELLAFVPAPAARAGYTTTGHRHIVHLPEAEPVFVFNPAAPAEPMHYAAATPGLYLHEPSGGILKAGAQDAYAKHKGIEVKLGPNTHLYVAESPIPNWAGKVYAIKARLGPDAKTLQALGPCQLSARNFGAEPEAIRKKYKLKAGSAAHLYFMQDADGHAALHIERVQ